MALLGRTNRLTINRFVDFGAFLDDKAGDEILLPRRYLPEGAAEGDQVDVFVYRDSEDRIIATTDQPVAEVGDCAFLECVMVSRVGAFLKWGLDKDLFAPFGEQLKEMKVGKKYPVYIYIDNTDRLAASSKLHKFLPATTTEYKAGDEVDLFVSRHTQLGWEVAVDDLVLGMIFESDALTTLTPGMRLEGIVKNVRHDNKLDIALAPPVERDELSDAILKTLREGDGTSTLTDKSSPDDIFAKYGASKRAYKSAIGGLYRERLITISNEKIELTED